MARMVHIREDHLAIAALIVLLVFGLMAGFTSERLTGAVVHADCHEGKVGDWNYCTEECPCEMTEGDCDSNKQCKIGLKCVDNFGPEVGFNGWVDVCVDYPAYLKYREANKKEPVTYVIN